MEEANRVGWERLEKGLEGRSRKVSKITFTICPVLKSQLTGLGLPPSAWPYPYSRLTLLGHPGAVHRTL